MNKYTTALIVAIPVWAAISMIILDALMTAYGKDSPMLFLAPVCAVAIALAGGALLSRLLDGNKP